MIEQIKSKSYKANYTLNAAGFPTGVFFTNDYMVENVRRFNEVIIIDATYGTNNLKMPLICAYGVSNVGVFTLKTFLIAFAWTSDEKEETYKWFLNSLQNVLQGIPDNTVFVAEKKRKSNDATHHMNIPKKRSRTFVRPRLQEAYFPFAIHSSNPKSDVSEAYDPVGDGHCGFRSASFLVHGNERLYPIIKQEML